MRQVSASTAQVDLLSTAEATAFGSGTERVAGGHAGADHLLDAAEHLLVLDLLVAEAHQRLERGLVAEPVVAAHLEHLGGDEALDQPEDIGVACGPGSG